jgi:hypothetical protein
VQAIINLRKSNVLLFQTLQLHKTLVSAKQRCAYVSTDLNSQQNPVSVHLLFNKAEGGLKFSSVSEDTGASANPVCPLAGA